MSVPTDGVGGNGNNTPTRAPIRTPAQTAPPQDQPPVQEPVTNPPAGVITGPPVPVVAVICDSGERCLAVGETCVDGRTESCCGDTFDSFRCECDEDGTGELSFVCSFTDACLFPVCEGEGDDEANDDASDDEVLDTPSPVPAPAAGFNCPSTSLVGCTAVDITSPVDDCPTIGEPCAGEGEFCCQDSCPRNYCTAKQSPVKRSIVPEIAAFVADMPTDWHDALKNTVKNDPERR